VQAKGVPDKMKVARLTGKMEQVVCENNGWITECFNASHRGWCKLEEARQQARKTREEHCQDASEAKATFEEQMTAQNGFHNPLPIVVPTQADVRNSRDDNDDMPAIAKLLNVPQDPRQQKVGRSKLAVNAASPAATPRPLNGCAALPANISPKSGGFPDSPKLRTPRSRHDTQPALNPTAPSQQCAQVTATGAAWEKAFQVQRKKTTTAINPMLDSKAGVQVRVSVPEQPKSSTTVGATVGPKRSSV